MKPVSMVLQEARARIEDPARWCQMQSEDGSGRVCAAQALRECGDYSSEAREVLQQVATLLMVEDEATSPIVRVNDGLGHAAVMEMYDIAISAALSDEAAK